MIWVSIGILVAQLIIAIVTYLTIHRHRSIFSIKTAVLRMPQGTHDDIYALNTEHINTALRDGKYTVLQIVERYADKDLEIIMGQIKK
ncbi:hypothetical protein ES703_57582 [subsurface metagenome]